MNTEHNYAYRFSYAEQSLASAVAAIEVTGDV
jgi:hypothetical protein